MLSRYASLALLLLSYSATSLEARGYKRHKRASCRTKASCKDLNNPCQCYCSAKGGFRDKQDDDKPIYVANDENKIYCYCKQWDRDKYPQAERPAEIA
jgi:hypothetical protein